ncbi:MAG: hypothetical protein QG635_150 [Bacteroidota bacterium]|nr:hypothetical protein [Bacteroidota bacterium]
MSNIVFVILAMIIASTVSCRGNEDSIKEGNSMSDKIKLPQPVYNSQNSIEKALHERRSVRSYKSEPLKLGEISQLLWAGYGITKPLSEPAFLRGGFRTAPSAGALYPLELYLVAGNVEGLSAGIYKYYSEEHALKLIAEGDFRKKLCEAAFSQTMLEEAPASIVYSAVYERTSGKYGSRGRERYVCIDLGCSAENVWLQAVSLGIGTVSVGSFNDEKVKILLKIPQEEEPLLIMPLGRKQD